MADAVDYIDAGEPQRAKVLLIAAQQRVEQKIMEMPDGAAIAFLKKKPKDDKER